MSTPIPREHHQWHSETLGQTMELLMFGHAGKPMLVFPCQEGRFHDFEDNGMIETLRPWLESGQIRLFTVDSIDGQSWCNWNIHPYDRARRHEAYERYLTDEVMPFIRRYTEALLLVSGCSMGGYHAANYFFRHPDWCDALIALSGLYHLQLFIGDYMDECVYYHSPLAFLPELTDEWYLERFRQSQIVVGVGQGAWEEEMLADTRRLKEILEAKQIPALVDIWGADVNHDWPWWHKMLPYFLSKMDLSSQRRETSPLLP